MRRNATAVAKSTPGAIGNNETRSGEFCRGMTLFTAIFHVAYALFMDTGILHLTGRSCHDNKSPRADPFIVLSRIIAGKTKCVKTSFSPQIHAETRQGKA
ncbi:hypothetical protein Q5T65_004997 [Salmonella enterica]|nr:hypothetical protein [Salmonella enterica]ELG7622908.1 hypothetical protein [Salmonella enterica]